jgi:tripartite-type tricarboxylate transporter receptor subunit TctC
MTTISTYSIDGPIGTGRAGTAIKLVALAGLIALHAAPGHADDAYPSRSIQMIVPFSPGGATDILARLIADRFREKWGQTVVVDNRVGASGNVGANFVAKAAPDGYTLLTGAIGTNAVNVALFETMPYDTANDFTPVVQLASFPMLLVVHPSVPAKSLNELMALAREKPGALNHGSAGKGASQHLAALLFESMTGARLQHVFYRGAAAMLPDLLSGRIQLSFGDMASILPYVKSGELRAIAVTANKRSRLLPDVPTLDEAGLKGYDASAWYGVFAPARTSPAIVDKLNAEVVGALKTEQMSNRLAQLGGDPVGSTPAAFKAFVQGEMTRWSDVIRKADIKPE